MCGIVGYVGKKNAVEVAVNGLQRLEYRGYDSAGIAIQVASGLMIEKTVGKVAVLAKKLLDAPSGQVAIAHTRWATHGKPSEQNAHPHQDCAGSIAVVHNGIIENHILLKNGLIREGHIFSSDTDTEVLAHLVERSMKEYARAGLDEIVLDALRHVEGTFGVAVISALHPGTIVAARRGSPLIVGVGNGEYMIASDVSAIVEHTKQVIYMNDNELVILDQDGYRVVHFSRKPITKEIDTIDWNIGAAQKNGYEHFMHKEIMEIPEVVENAIRGRLSLKVGAIKLGGLEEVEDRLRLIRRIVIVGCGTSYYAGLLGQRYFESLATIPTTTAYASEFRYNPLIIDEYTAVIAISQSGETADTLEAIRIAKKRGSVVLGVVNVVGSSIARESDAGIYNHAGPEISVASTKAFVSQLAVLMTTALWFGIRRNPQNPAISEIMRELKSMPFLIKKILEQDSSIQSLAKKYLSYDHIIFIGRGSSYPVALEGALKLKEISYRFAEGYPAGELKHGPIALIDPSVLTIAIMPHDSLYEKMTSNIEEIRARSGSVVAITTHGAPSRDTLVDDIVSVPLVSELLQPLLSVIPLQLFAYHTAALLGRDVDMPRNLAKSVTVE
jgi:glucosamine--fructose-6-phosphate aminotransferase (isomerizing)